MNNDAQIAFLRTIEGLLPPNVSLVSELSQVLEISSDSVYRRLRGETVLGFEEVKRLCSKYRLSFDAFVQSEATNMVTFGYHSFDNTIEQFKAYFENLHTEIKAIRLASNQDKHVLYAGQGIPIFHYLKFTRLTAFKMFYWMKYIMNIPEYQNASFKVEQIDEELLEYGKGIFQHYLHLPSTEIWTDSTVLGTLHQIQFYWNCGMFDTKYEALLLCQEVKELLLHVQKCAAQSKKQDDFQNPTEYGTGINLYFSEIEFENNCIVVRVGDTKRVYLGQLSFETLATENLRYYRETEQWLTNIVKKSNLISGVAETMRYQFFKRSLRHLNSLEQRIEND
ncbi:MAG: hypothetical protein JXQ90_05315 [Cyclobacteriaceae bacterium]